MTFTKSRFVSFEAYLAAEPCDLPEGFYEYWDGELVEVMTESLFNDTIANFIFVVLLEAGVPMELLRPGKVEVAVPGRPRTRFPDLTVLDEIHITLLEKRATITPKMPPPRVLVEVVSPGKETDENYLRDYRDKPIQYAAIGVCEMWRIDPSRQWVQVGILTAGEYQFKTFTGNEIILSSTFPGLSLTAAQVLRAKR
ncbi:MAG: Uma2 family endonuclease [Alkalinema sp. CAN_BIN05]|nr:Uma2 family endonuclease [Alkalinema sp. CAN_BIN05]